MNVLFALFSFNSGIFAGMNICNILTSHYPIIHENKYPRKLYIHIYNIQYIFLYLYVQTLTLLKNNPTICYRRLLLEGYILKTAFWVKRRA